MFGVRVSLVLTLPNDKSLSVDFSKLNPQHAPHLSGAASAAPSPSVTAGTLVSWLIRKLYKMLAIVNYLLIIDCWQFLNWQNVNKSLLTIENHLYSLNKTTSSRPRICCFFSNRSKNNCCLVFIQTPVLLTFNLWAKIFSAWVCVGCWKNGVPCPMWCFRSNKPPHVGTCWDDMTWLCRLCLPPRRADPRGPIAWMPRSMPGSEQLWVLLVDKNSLCQ